MTPNGGWSDMTLVAAREAPHLESAHADYRSDIDGLRAIAVCLVVIYHAFPSALPGGYVGVDVFFVISGYLITGIIVREGEKGIFSFRRFYARRVKRIFPALAVVLCGTLAIGWFVLSPTALADLGSHVVSSAAFVPNITVWNQSGYFDDSAISKPLLHLWSLGIEEQFYFVWPLLLAAVLRRRRFVTPVVVIAGAVSFVLCLRLLDTDASGAYFLPWSRAWELCVGALLATTRPSWDRMSRAAVFTRSMASYVGLGVIVVAAMSLDADSRFPGWLALFPTIGAGLIVVSRGSKANQLLGSRGFVAVGLISYPLYLWHWPLISFAYIKSQGRPSDAILVLVVALGFVLAALTYQFVELPLKRHAWRHATLVLVVAMLSIGTMGAVTAAADGFVGTESNSVQAVLNYADYDPGSDGARVGSCWLAAEQPAADFGPECVTAAGEPGILVWGDSHAARLYVGVRDLLGPSANIGQLTRNSCGPILEFQISAAGNCATSNNAVVDSLDANESSVVVMFADWSTYGIDYSQGSEMATLLANTIESVRGSSGGRTVVIGPAPRWFPDLPTSMYEDWQRQSPPRKLPIRLVPNGFVDVARIDVDMRKTVEAAGAEFVSLLDVVCDGDDCLTSVPGSPETLLTWDYGHLTTEGARFVAEQIDIDRFLGR